jgi:hypothetical protein
LKHGSVERYKQIAKNPAQNTGDSIDGGLTGKAFYCCHAGKGKEKRELFIDKSFVIVNALRLVQDVKDKILIISYYDK